MKSVIYVDSEGSIRADRTNDETKFKVFVDGLTPESILVLDGVVHEDNIPEDHKAIFPYVLRSFTKVWATNRTLLAPVETRKVVEEPEASLVIEDAPKATAKPKKARKKKVSND